MSTASFPPTLFKYLGWRYLKAIIGTTAVLMSIVYLLDVLELMRKLGKRPDVSNDMAFILSLYKLPDMALQVAPFVMLIGTLISFTKLTKDRELVAIRGAGLPARTFLLPALLVGLGIGVFNLTVVSPLAAVTLKKYEQIMNVYFPNSAQGVVTEGGRVWLRQPEKTKETFIFAEKVLEQGQRLEGVTIFSFDLNGNFKERIDADLMVHHPHLWQLFNIFKLTPDEPVAWQAEEKLASSLTPQVIANSLTSPKTMPVWKLYGFIENLKQAGLPSQKHELYFHKQLAMPALLIAMFLLAAPFSLRFSRSHGMGQVLVIGLFVGFGFYLFSNIIMNYGVSGRLPAWVAAWAPTAVASIVGVALFLYFREE